MAKADTKEFSLEITDPEIARPKELPLVVKPANGADWKNPQQAAYAKVLNGFAYQQPEKWAREKNDREDQVQTATGFQTVKVKGLLTKLIEIGDNPSLYSIHTNTNEGVNEATVIDKAAPNVLAA